MEPVEYIFQHLAQVQKSINFIFWIILGVYKW